MLAALASCYHPGVIRLYTWTGGTPSFATVAYGMRQALEAHKLCAGVVELDKLSHSTEPAGQPGADAPVAIAVGNPNAIISAWRMGNHRERWLLLAPNSNGLPPVAAEFIRGAAESGALTGLLAPSIWAKKVLEQFEVPVHLCPHGIDRVGLDRVGTHHVHNEYTALHVTSTNLRRKGTRELLEAWTHLYLPPDAKLIIAANPMFANEAEYQCRRLGTKNVTVALTGHLNRRDYLRELMAVDLVIQPSRAEGFGLVPLEARCIGVPVVATACTGHADHVPGPGSVVIPHGPDADSDDYPGSMAPTVDAAAIASAIHTAYDQRDALRAELTQSGSALRDVWSWPNVTGECLKKLAAKE